jgi:ribosomal protein L7Ae-like RNA K-turn-binding protein
VVTDGEQARSLLAEAAAHRVWQLLGAGARQGLLAAGAAPVLDAIAAERAALVLVAHDARAAAELGPVQALVAKGLVRAWGTKDELGRLCRRPEIGVLAVLDHGLAQRLFGAIAMALSASGAPSTRRLGPRGPEGSDGGRIE